jgi:A/G-specific adenine glycosylase
VFGLDISFHDTAGKKSFQEFAQSLLPHSKAALYNQAIMDLGATICTPKQPNCNQCPFEEHCQAKFLQRIDDFPVKKQRLILKIRHMHFLVFEDKHHLYITKRTEKDIWHNLYTFFMLESDSENVDLTPYYSIGTVEGEPQYADQTLTHQKIKGYFHRIKLFNPNALNKLKLQKVMKKDISAFAFPRILISFFQKNNYL